MQPKFYNIDEHLIPSEKVDKHAFYVVQKLRQKGFTAYLVGGSVRDLLLGKKPKDFDISTNAKPEEIKEIFRSCILIGKRFRLAHVRFGKKVLEVSTFRTGDPEVSTLIVRDNDFGTEEEDVLRRDFTINGLFYDPEAQTVIDYVGGYPDIQKKILRTIGHPEMRFRQDPVRMIRLLKFQARFGLKMEKETLAALKSCREDIVKSSQARIFEELLRMLESGAAMPFFKNLSSHGLLELLLPALHAHPGKKDVFTLLEQVDKEKERKELHRPLLMSCLIFPIFEKEIRKKAKEKNLHLGNIAESANRWIDEIFRPFFHIPRKMRGTMVFILTSQFRFVPLEEKTKRKIRIPFDVSFPMALHFFKVRCTLFPEYLEKYQQWAEASAKKFPKKARRKTPKKRCPKKSP